MELVFYLQGIFELHWGLLAGLPFFPKYQSIIKSFRLIKYYSGLRNALQESFLRALS